MITVSNLQKTYDPRSRIANTVLKDVSLSLPDTGFVCILGSSGCGKTSLLNAIGGLDDFQKGTIEAEGIRLHPHKFHEADELRSSKFGYIFQNYYLLPDHSVQYNVYLGLHGVQMSHVEKMRRVAQVLQRVDMARFARRKVSELSGGQQQRVAIARALAPSPKVIFADEPTGNLDEGNTLNICSLLRSISKDALVLMVTHETNLAKFFADRIITLKDGGIESDVTSWERSSLEIGGKLYTEDFRQSSAITESFSVELYAQDGASPVQITILSTKDRIIIKTDDPRTVSCSKNSEEPFVVKGARPEVTLENMEEGMDGAVIQTEPSKKPLPLSWKLRETVFLMRQKGLYRVGMIVFLVILTVLTCYSYGDWKTITSIDPRDFITTDSHLIEVTLDRGSQMPATKYVSDYYKSFLSYLESTEINFKFVPTVTTPATNSTSLVLQLSDISDSLGGFSYDQIDDLPEGSLILGRMPENSQEIVVDRWVLDNYLKKDGVLQNGIPGIEYFLGKQLNYQRKNYTPTIVGICDSGECAVYIPDAGLISIGVNGQEVISLSELQLLYPGVYDDISLDNGSCILVTNNAGKSYTSQIGGIFRTKGGLDFTIADAFEVDTYASMIVSDGMIQTMMESMVSTKMMLYCYEKEAMLNLLKEELPEELKDEIQIEVNDNYGKAMKQYETASKIRANARTIVTFTVMVLCLVMLFLLRRSQLQKRINMMAVYRLLGIRASDLIGIFCMEALFVSFVSSLPAAIITAMAIEIANSLPSLKFSMIFNIQDSALVFIGILIFYEVISAIPVIRMLRRPPAQIAQRIS